MKRLSIFLLLASSCLAQGRVSGMGRISGHGIIGSPVINSTPLMGWNSWYWNFQNNYPAGVWQPTEAYIKQQSDALVSTGLAALGYKYVGIDGGWMDRDGGGELEAIPSQFPDGLPSLVSYVHNDGLLLGLYGTPAAPCIAGTVNQLGHEFADAIAIASWGIDFWKYDGCGLTGADPAVQSSYQLFGTALQSTGKNISYLVNQYAQFGSVQWFAHIGADSVRIDQDNGDGFWYQKAQDDPWPTYALSQTKGHWLDPDYLMGGLKEGAGGAVGGGVVVSDMEARAQFNWYAIGAFPLVIGTRIDLLDATNLETYSNAEVIAVNQDALGIMGARTSSIPCGGTVCEVWVRKLATGYAIALINYDPSAAHTVSVAWTDFSQSGTWDIRDLWAHASAGSSDTGYSVSLPAWGSAMIKITQ
jgi:alpha-galactosidase